ncbi:GNAT family N-acetyltransferase [Cellulomonas edaphi]|uniref:GNAT family N-acetyltransferase n=1 Tax=Cellulomonas edaphi TaxID=3053468 RepID=A0ABT7S445_9CELL|nr:GNAT family N-acetyltransferase [Cellulomons edaphi]MDM7830289.1 GNAT family N-acetyltransferase [Cellulomons edaphi]
MTIDVVDVPEESRFEARGQDGELMGVAFYDVIGTTVAFTHTEVDEKYEGQGVAGQLVRAALDSVRAQGNRRVAPLCPYVKAWIARHPDYQDLVGPS